MGISEHLKYTHQLQIHGSMLTFSGKIVCVCKCKKMRFYAHFPRSTQMNQFEVLMRMFKITLKPLE